MTAIGETLVIVLLAGVVFMMYAVNRNLCGMVYVLADRAKKKQGD